MRPALPPGEQEEEQGAQGPRALQQAGLGSIGVVPPGPKP